MSGHPSLAMTCCVPLPEPECALSSPTTYFWYRQTLDVTPEMGVGGGLQPALVGGLLGAWALVGASLLKGIKSSGKVGDVAGGLLELGVGGTEPGD